MGNNEKYMHERTDMTIDDYPKKTLIVADIIRRMDGKTCIRIIDDNTDDLLYDDRCVQSSSEGCASSLCNKEIEDIDTFNGKIELRVSM